MQTILVVIILTLSVGYAAWRVYTALSNNRKRTCDGCKGCPANGNGCIR